MSPPKPLFSLPIGGQTSWYPPNVPVIVHNKSNYPLVVQAAVADKVIQVSVTEYGPNPLQQALTEAKAVLGDLLLEKVVGLKVYVVKYEPFEDGDALLPLVHLSSASANAWVAKNRQEPGPMPNWRSNSGESQNIWMSGNYTITEHTLHLESP